MATVTSLGFSIFSTYSGTGVSAARRDLASLQRDLDKSKTKLGSATSSFFSLSTAAAALGPALAPIGGAALAGAGAMTTLGASGGIAAGIIGLAFKAALKGTNDSSKQMHNLMLSLKGDLGIGKKAVSSFGNDVSPLLVEPFRIGVTTIMTHLRDLVGVISAFRPLILGVATAFKSWTDNGLQGWLNWVNANGVPIMANFITMAKNLGRVFGDLLRAFAPMAQTMSSQLAILSAKLKGWADGGGFIRFIDAIKGQGPQISEFFRTLGEALKKVSTSLAGLGPVSLSLSITLLKIVAAMPPPLIQAIVIAIVAWRFATMAMAVEAVLAAAANFILADSLIVTTGMVVAMELSILLLIVAVAAIVVGIYYLVTNWNTVWNAIKSTAQTVWSFMTHGLGQLTLLLLGIPGALIFIYLHWQQIWTAMQIAAAAVWNALKVAWAAFINAMNTTWLAVSGALRASWSAVWNAMNAAAMAIWNALRAAWQAFFASMSAVFAAFNAGMRAAWSNLWNAVRSAAQAVWNALSGAFRAFFSTMSSVFAGFNSGMRSAWSNLWNAVKSVASAVWSSISGGFKSFASGVQSTLSGLVSAAKKIWGGIVSVFKDPINLVIGIWDKVADVFHLPHITPLASGGLVGAPNVGAGGAGGGTTAFASGGSVRGPGGPTADKIPAMLSNGEFVVKAAAVSHYGVDNMYALNSMKLAAGGLASSKPSMGIPGMALGGIIPSPGDIIGAIGGVLGSAAASALKDLIGDAFMKAVTPILDGFAPPDPAPTGGITSIPHAAYKLIEKSVLDLLKDASNIGGVIPVGEHKAVIDAALKAAGVPPPGSLAEWEAGLNTLITRESAWNSGAINLTDSNAQAGHPSQGLAQTIPSTFAAYHVAGTSNNILDPVANVAAAIRYIVATYGNITNVQQANANLPPAGYWRGTNNARKGWARVGERGEEWVNFGGGETVLPHGRRPQGGDIHHHHINMENHWNGNPDKEAVQYAESDMTESLRQSLHAGVGGRSH